MSIERPDADFFPSDEPRFAKGPTGDTIFYRIDGVSPVVCKTHLLELAKFKFHGESLKVKAVSPRELLYGIEQLECTCCRTRTVHGHTCLACKTPLHPRWPAVYCSSRCAMDDV